MLELVLYFVPKRGVPQALLDNLSKAWPARRAMHSRSECNVVEDRFRERIGALKDHADLSSDNGRVHFGVVDILVIEEDLPLNPGAGDQILQSVEGAQEGRLARARRADDGGDLIDRDIKRDVLEGLKAAVEEAEVLACSF